MVVDIPGWFVLDSFGLRRCCCSKCGFGVCWEFGFVWGWWFGAYWEAVVLCDLCDEWFVWLCDGCFVGFAACLRDLVRLGVLVGVVGG